MQTESIRRKIYNAFNNNGLKSGTFSRLNKFIVFIIVFSILLAVLETEERILLKNIKLFYVLEIILTAAFVLEYIVRIWVAPEDKRYSGDYGRIKYCFSFYAMIDFLVIFPFLISIGNPELYILRVARLFRIFTIAKLGRFSQSLYLFGRAIKDRKYDFLLTIIFAMLLILISSTLLYLAEGTRQPETFGSIPRALWCAVASLTPAGYGDAFPITLMGKVVSAITALAGIGLIAMPTSILASAFSSAIAEMKKTQLKEKE